jgi:hypothetical protein
VQDLSWLMRQEFRASIEQDAPREGAGCVLVHLKPQQSYKVVGNGSQVFSVKLYCLLAGFCSSEVVVMPGRTLVSQ